jgi:hypothetical protein|tara:strand:- start:65 stop:283 length:219 start_codon:yes stop_codon:yes gene_type:complete
MEKIIVITLLFLNWNGDIKQESFEIFESCDTWFHTNVRVHERKQRKVFSNHYYHTYEGKQVIGYICSDSLPQ